MDAFPMLKIHSKRYLFTQSLRVHFQLFSQYGYKNEDQCLDG